MQGVPATATQWGAWAGTGMAAQNATLQQHLERVGMGLVPPARGLQVLASVLASQRSVHGPGPNSASAVLLWRSLLVDGRQSLPFYQQFSHHAGVGLVHAALLVCDAPSFSELLRPALPEVMKHSVHASTFMRMSCIPNV